MRRYDRRSGSLQGIIIYFMKWIVKIIIIALIASGVYLFVIQQDVQQVADVEEVSYQEILQRETVESSESSEEGTLEESEIIEEPDDIVEVEEVSLEAFDEKESGEEIEIPTEFNLAVPFTSQAPHANWELPYQEACEEASAYMVSLYFSGASSGQIDADVADAQLLEAVAFEEDYFGFYLDTTALETAKFIDLFYGYQAYVVEDPTVEQIKAEVAAGRPVIVPAAGRELDNPNFTGLGPLYHMFLIKGYTESQFITNDPGTRNGEGFVYTIENVMSAMGDWNNGDPTNGAKRVIFVGP
jgi:hypothetical protein